MVNEIEDNEEEEYVSNNMISWDVKDGIDIYRSWLLRMINKEYHVFVAN